MSHVHGMPFVLAEQLFGFSPADLFVLFCYFVCILGIGWWAMRRIRNQDDYFLAGRRFGKLIQVFASFGQATSSDTAVSATTMVSTNGAAGVWAGLAGGLINLPMMWFWSMWFRRVRLTTLADIYEERYGSKAMAGFYALTQGLFLIVLAGLGLVALSKTVAAIAVKPETALTVAERAEYDLSRELHQLESRDYLSLAPAQQARLNELRQLNPRGEFSYVNERMLLVVMAAVVLVYAGLGGLEGAFITDLVQGILLLILSVLLLPFAAARINQLFGTSGVLGPFQAMHRELPQSFFELWGSPGVPEFTWYWILVYALTGVINIAVQANGMVGPASSRDDYTARYGFVVGLFIKRYAMVFWGFLAMMALLLYGTNVKDADYVWGLATRDLLGRAGFGLVGLMVACLMAALMSTMSAHQMCVSSLLTRNIYLPLVRWFRLSSARTTPAMASASMTNSWATAERPSNSSAGEGGTAADANAGLSERHMIWMGRLFGLVYVSGGVLVATQFHSVFGLMKFIVIFNAIVAASFWMGMLWRRATRVGAWCSMIVTFLMILVLPFSLPLIPGLRSNAYLLKRTDQPPVIRVYVARPADVTERQRMIEQWDRSGHEGPRPDELVLGQRFERTFKIPPKSVFWASDIEMKDGKSIGAGFLKVELILLDAMGWNLSRNSYALNETLAMLMKIVVPFATLMLVSFFSASEDKRKLDLFFVKMKTRVDADPQIDAREMAISHANPHRFDHLKLLPGSNWEFRKWDWEDLKGVIGSLVAAGGCVVLLYLMVTLGK